VRSCIALLVVGVLVASCSDDTSGERKAETGPPATETTIKLRPRDLPDRGGRDLAWLARLQRWEANLRQDGLTLASMGRDVQNKSRARRALRRPLRELARCEQRLLGHVGEPRAARYRSGYDLLLKGCQSVKRMALGLSRSIEEREPIPVAMVRRESDRSTRFFRRGSSNLERTLRANRPLPVTSGSRAESKIEPRLSRFASRLVVRKPTGIEVRCWSTREWPFVRKEWGAYIGRGDLLGFVHSLRPRTSVAPVVCRPLARFIYRRERPTAGLPLFRTAEAVGILAHEAEHIRNNLRRSEATTECHAMQHMRQLARIMGASKSYADLLAATYWTDLYPLNPPEYRTTACRDGGPLDLRPASGIWP
jgi:hypothetical protein